MNPEEGGLRPQLLDRFGLLVPVTAVPTRELRLQVLTTVLAFDEARDDPTSPWMAAAERDNEEIRQQLTAIVHEIAGAVISVVPCRLFGGDGRH